MLAPRSQAHALAKRLLIGCRRGSPRWSSRGRV